MTGSSFNKVFGGAMLVAGTCIGAGMLGLPISTAASGFYPSTIAFLVCWVMMTLSALLMLEVSLWYPEETNLITMAKSTLGKAGESIAWICYVLFLYALMAAYTSGAAGLIGEGLTKIGLNAKWGIWIIVSLFGLVVYLGAKWVDGVNRIFMLFLVFAYFALVYHVVPQVSPSLLKEGHPKFLFSTAPLLVTSFGFHLLIPSLKNYMHGDIKGLRRAIIGGSLLPLVVYLLWELLILGVVPVSGDKGLVAMMQAEKNSGRQAVVELTQLLSQILNNHRINLLVGSFAISAILTSFIGVALGLFDFFADGFHIKKTWRGRLVLAILTFMPPVLIAIYCPQFLLALHYAGMFAAVLLIIYPVLMVWSGRYRLKIASSYQVMGGKPLLILVLLFGLGVIVLEGLDHLKWLPEPFVQERLFD
ncbi:aromatic amino acid transport family protein [Candidatus Berkiella aquae]|uniref:Tryptophan/tyrosine permease n=1 Tax=Candidatus Berkiella aquae TaxID=295108 RepID=A0A0Q9YZD0_9GAMM|nr:aromatic amino acid transport family protein [Candidatus Berkiella aquae]MCS5712411.1 tryptophan/tyrosine permease [Candidatus Berkiella aquae]